MDLIGLGELSLRNLGSINIILGKNGCGKSFLLKNADSVVRGGENVGRVRYLSPERGGLVQYDAAADQQIGRDPNWLPSIRRKNQAPDFRSQSGAFFRRLESMVLRGIERDQTKAGYAPRTFDTEVARLNTLLDRVRLERNDAQAFLLHIVSTGDLTQPVDLSSGESELISLGIEFLSFVEEAEKGKENFLFVDEPDVHLHPDLQERLARFIVEAVEGKPVTLVIATHSTALLREFAAARGRVGFMRRGDKDVVFQEISDVDKAILPIFGAHPLSNVFNEAPILLVEGEDDARVWQQAVRSSDGRIRIFPCSVEGKPRFAEYEIEVDKIIGSIYDDARAYSLRDRDLQPEFIDNLGRVVRMRLSCRAAENLMLTDDVLASVRTDWISLQERLRAWMQAHPNHQYAGHLRAFIEGGLNRKGHDLKEIRNIIVGELSNKPWEVLVGKAIAALELDEGADGDGSLRDFLGPAVCTTLLDRRGYGYLPRSSTLRLPREVE